MSKETWPFILSDSKEPPPHYDPPVLFDANKMVQERDVMVRMRDGVHLAIDIYRPGAQGKFPVLLAIARHNKDLQTPEACEQARCARNPPGRPSGWGRRRPGTPGTLCPGATCILLAT